MKDEHFRPGLDIAVIGISARFPGANNYNEFWENLVNEKESISFFNDKELIDEGNDPEIIKKNNYIKAKGIIEDYDGFDANFFSIPPSEAVIIDPQIRQFLECSWEALEDASCNPEEYKGSIGIYSGASNSFFWELKTFLAKMNTESAFSLALHNNKDLISNFIAYKLNLIGPSCTVSSACSTSLSAIHLATQGLIGGECDTAIAGGVSIALPNKSGYMHEKDMILSSDGHCRAFDEKADGVVFSNGVGVVILKRIEDAINDKDNIYAVIKGSALNNDGNQKIGFTAPSVIGQSDVIETALNIAEVESDDISFIEAHGTGTSLGDPIEIEGLVKAFNTNFKQKCAIGSVKTNIGHLDAASGVAGFIKAVLSLKNRILPASLHFNSGNLKIGFENTPFYVNSKTSELDKDNHLFAGVSSFGVGGANVHIVLSTPPQKDEINASNKINILCLSGKSEKVLKRNSDNLVTFLKDNPNINPSELAYTLQIGRKHLNNRRTLLFESINDVVYQLKESNERIVKDNIVDTLNKDIVFAFTGQGAQYVNMGKKLYEDEPVFRKNLDYCLNYLEKKSNTNFREILFNDEENNLINKTNNSQPIVFSFEYSLAQLLMSWGIDPKYTIGYSFGEYVSACLSGVFNLESALELIIERGKLMAKVKVGAMLSIPVSSKELLILLNDFNGTVSVAVDNGLSCIVSGSAESISELELFFKNKKYLCMPVSVSHAGHSAEMDSILDEFRSCIEKVKLQKPNKPFISCITGNFITDEEATNPQYWVDHLRKTVCFVKGIELLSKENAIFIEVGPGRDLCNIINRVIPKNIDNVISTISSKTNNVDDCKFIYSKVALLWRKGQQINWNEFYHNSKPNKVSLPTYSFEHKKFNVNVNPIKYLNGDISNKELKKIDNINEWFYVPEWDRSNNITTEEIHDEKIWLLFVDTNNFSNKLKDRIGSNAVYVFKGDSFKVEEKNNIYIDSSDINSYISLFNHLVNINMTPDRIVHTWCRNSDVNCNVNTIENINKYGLYSIVSLMKAIDKAELNKQIELNVIATNTLSIIGNELISPAKSITLGALKCIPQEMLYIRSRFIDVELGNDNVSEIYNELKSSIDETVVGFRGKHRWVQRFRKIELNTKSKQEILLKTEGAYLITGGLGNIGIILSKFLAKEYKSNLILTGRTKLPAREEWDEALLSACPSVINKIQLIREIESYNVKVLYCNADVSNLEDMQQVVKEAEDNFENIDGVIHAAGIIRAKSSQTGIVNITDTDFKEQFLPKIYGTIVLDEVLKGKELDFCILISSLAPLLGGLGFTAYATANLFMDSYVQYRNQVNSNHWLSVNWGDWEFNGENNSEISFGESLKVLEMKPEEGIETFKRILAVSDKLDEIVISSGDLDLRHKQWIEFKNIHDIDNDNRSYDVSFTRPELSTEYVAPYNNIQKELVEIWQRIFNLNEIGILDNFFELGGDSLKVIKTLSIIHKKINVEIAITEFFKNPTISLLSDIISKKSTSHYVSIPKSPSMDNYPLSPAQKRLYIIQSTLPNSIIYNDLQVLSLKGCLNRDRLLKVFKKLIHRHGSLRTSFHVGSNGYVQKVHEEVEFEILDLEGDYLDNIISDFKASFDLSSAPLIRVGLITLSESEYILLIDMHHIITDGISYTLLIRDLMDLYNGKKLQQFSTDYIDYTMWKLETEKIEYKKYSGYWKDKFSNGIKSTDLPIDFDRPDIPMFEGNNIVLELDMDTVSKINTLFIENEITLFHFFLTVFNILLYKYTGNESIVIGSPEAGRNHADIQNIIGLFVNIMPLVNNPNGDKTFNEFLNEVKENSLNDFNNKDMDFNMLAKDIGIESNISRNPFFDVVFLMQNMEEIKIQLDQLEVRQLPNLDNTTRFDLFLHAIEKNKKIILTFQYSTSLFKKETIKKLSEHYLEIIEQVLDDNSFCNINSIQLSSGLNKVVPVNNSELFNNFNF